MHDDLGRWIAPAAVGFDAREGRRHDRRRSGRGSEPADTDRCGAGIVARRARSHLVERVQRELASRTEPQLRVPRARRRRGAPGVRSGRVRDRSLGSSGRPSFGSQLVPSESGSADGLLRSDGARRVRRALWCPRVGRSSSSSANSPTADRRCHRRSRATGPGSRIGDRIAESARGRGDPPKAATPAQRFLSPASRSRPDRCWVEGVVVEHDSSTRPAWRSVSSRGPLRSGWARKEGGVRTRTPPSLAPACLRGGGCPCHLTSRALLR